VLETLDHPNIVKVLDVYQDQMMLNDRFTLVTEYIDGRDLFDETIKRERFSEREAARVLKQLLLAVNYLHNKGIAHRDIKTENILMSDKDTSATIEIKLIDFGLACPFNSPEIKNKVAGTMLYMAPEILKK
jgi:calcium-dependent protein kinase